MPEIQRALSFDVGIERLTYTETQAPTLPGQKALPADAPVVQQLTELLYPRSFEQTLLDELRPDVEHRGLLTPGEYHDMADVALAELRAALEQATAADAREALQSAIALLEEDKSLRQLFNTYRHLLHRA
jgi:hypothetical protein